MQHQLIESVSEQSKALVGVVARPRLVGRDEGGGYLRGLARRNDAIDGGDKLRILKTARNTQKVRQVEMAKPQRVDTGYRGDRLDV